MINKLEIPPKDLMFEGDLNHYFYVGVDALRICLRFAKLKPNSKVLLLPCGHGRNLRHFTDFFDINNIYAADINSDAVNFCETYFGVNSFTSDKEFSFLKKTPNFDLIFVGSLITHLKESHSIDLIEKLIKKLSRNGVLILSSHGTFVANKLAENCMEYGLTDAEFSSLQESFNASGYGFGAYQNDPEYGISVISKNWFEKYIILRNHAVLENFEERLWDRHHDIIVIRKHRKLRFLLLKIINSSKKFIT